MTSDEIEAVAKKLDGEGISRAATLIRRLRDENTRLTASLKALEEARDRAWKADPNAQQERFNQHYPEPNQKRLTAEELARLWGFKYDKSQEPKP